MQILVVEDDQLLNSSLCYNLNLTGYTVDSALTKKDALRLFHQTTYDLIILDVNLPDGNGFELCKQFKQLKSDILVIFLTANDMESDMLKGYELGAVDYVTKPFPLSVFQKKVSALMSRITNKKTSDCYDDHHLFINFSDMTASLAGKPLTFSAMEYRMLKVFTQNANHVLTRRVLLERLWDIDCNFVDEHALTVTISRIRNKIETSSIKYIKTVYGMGYMWIGGIENGSR